jgi:membrane protein DedA with SNARE-associated domain
MVGIINWLVNVISTLGYPGIAFLTFLDSSFIPIPSEIVLPFSGFVASRGNLSVVLIVIIASISACLGALAFYSIGRLGKKKVDGFLDKYGKYFFLDREDLDKSYAFFNKYGNFAVFFGRIVPIVRLLISFPAGVSGMSPYVFSAYSFAGSFLWSCVLVAAGYLLGEKWELVAVYIGKYQDIIIAIFAILVVFLVARGIYKVSKKRKTSK